MSKIPIIALLLFGFGGGALGFFIGTRRVRRRALFGDDYIGSPTHRRIMRRRHLMRLVNTLLYALAGIVAGFVFLLVTGRR